MKRNFKKTIGILAGAALSLSLLAACGTPAAPTLGYDDGVAKAFHAVAPQSGLISQTAVEDGEAYLVTVITTSAVAEYRVDADFKVGDANTIVGSDIALTALEESAPRSDLERAYERALELSGVTREEVTGFDFDRDTYRGKAVFKVEIEDASAEYSFILDAADLTLLSSKTELKTSAPAGQGSSYIGEAKAKELALGAVGIEESACEGFTLKSMPENGRRLYEASFSYDGFRYTVDVDALTGAIVKLSKSVLDESVTYPDIPALLSEEEARAAALATVFPEGAEGHEVHFGRVELDYERGRFVYEIELFADGKEYEIELSADDGTVLDMEIGEEEPLPPQSGSFLTREQAVALVMERAGEGAFLLDVEIDVRRVGNEKRYFYEIEVKANGRELEFYVDALTGEVTSNDEYTGNPLDPAASISEEKALAIALDAFKLTEESLTYKRIHLEMDDGRLCYDIKLMVGGAEYEMTLDALTGAILEQEADPEHESELPSRPSESGYLTPAEAREAVLGYFRALGKTARVDADDVEWEDRGTGAEKRFCYEVEAKVDGREYECYVDALTGEVTLKGELIGSATGLIGEEQALAIALDYCSVAKSEARVIKVKLEEDDGILIYEVEFKVNSIEYDFEIDAKTGAILEYDRSYDD